MALEPEEADTVAERHRILIAAAVAAVAGERTRIAGVRPLPWALRGRQRLRLMRALLHQEAAVQTAPDQGDEEEEVVP